MKIPLHDVLGLLVAGGSPKKKSVMDSCSHLRRLPQSVVSSQGAPPSRDRFDHLSWLHPRDPPQTTGAPHGVPRFRLLGLVKVRGNPLIQCLSRYHWCFQGCLGLAPLSGWIWPSSKWASLKDSALHAMVSRTMKCPCYFVTRFRPVRYPHISGWIINSIKHSCYWKLLPTSFSRRVCGFCILRWKLVERLLQ